MLGATRRATRLSNSLSSTVGWSLSATPPPSTMAAVTFNPLVLSAKASVRGAAVRRAGAKASKRALAGSAPDRELAERRAVLKAAVYLQAWLLQEAEKLNAAAADAATAIKPARGKGGKKAAAAKAADTDFSWDAQRETAVLRLLEALELNLTELWGHRQPDEAFLALFARCAYTILEQPAALKSGAASLRDCLWRLIALPAVKFEQAEATVSGACAGCVCGRHLPHGQHSRRGSARWSRRLGEVGSGRRALLAGLVKLLLGAEHAASPKHTSW